jgi:hypothetical protein
MSPLGFFFAALGFELRASWLLKRHSYYFSYSTSPLFMMGISRWGLSNYLPRLASNHNPDLCLLNN